MTVIIEDFVASLNECMNKIKGSEDKLKVETAIAKDAITKHEIRTQKIMQDVLNYGQNLIQAQSDRESALNKRKASLMQRENEIKAHEAIHQEFLKQKKEWEDNAAVVKEQNAISESMVRLNVGGKKFDVSVNTLTKGESDFFDALFSGAWKLDSSKDDGLFIDRDGTLYEYIFNYLRDGAKVVLPKDEPSIKRLRLEAEYLGLPALLKLLVYKPEKISKLQSFEFTELKKLLEEKSKPLVHGKLTFTCCNASYVHTTDSSGKFKCPLCLKVYKINQE